MNARTFGNGDAQARAEAKYSEADLAQMNADQRAKHEGRRPAVVVAHIQRATDKAIQFLVDLNAERFPNVTEKAVRAWAEGVHWSEVSAKIDWLKTQPKTLNSGLGSTGYDDIPVGRYAVTGDKGQTVFVKVTRPAEGVFKGRTFVNIQAGDELLRVSATTRNVLLLKISNDGPANASRRYGREIGSCGVCGRTLTDEESRSAGIGPVCSSKTGW